MEVFVSSVLGVCLGAALAYIVGIALARRASMARRKALIKVLHRELSTIPFTPAGIEPGKPVHRRTFHLSSVPYLLDGNLLNPEEDYELIRALSLLKTAEYWHNEALYLANMSYIQAQDDSLAMQQHFIDAVENAHNHLREMMLWVREQIPPDTTQYGPIPEWPRPDAGESRMKSRPGLGDRLKRGWRTK